MILQEHNISDWVTYTPSDGHTEQGRIKIFDNEKQVAWVVYKANENWDGDHWKDYTGESTKYSDLYLNPMGMKLESSTDIGEQVWCDMCCKEFTDSTEKGGLLFGSKACCPDCAPNIQVKAVQYGETDYIKGYCPEGMTFKDWCVQLRDGNNTIRIYQDYNQGSSLLQYLH